MCNNYNNNYNNFGNWHRSDSREEKTKKTTRNILNLERKKAANVVLSIEIVTAAVENLCYSSFKRGQRSKCVANCLKILLRSFRSWLSKEGCIDCLASSKGLLTDRRGNPHIQPLCYQGRP